MKQNHWAQHYIGLPWQAGGRSLSGFDCWGLVVWIQQYHFSRALPDIGVHPKYLNSRYAL